MRKSLGVLCLMAALAISLLAAPLYANESVAIKRTVIASKYDISKEITVDGAIQSVVKKPAAGAMVGTHLIVSTSQGTVDAHIGNYLGSGKHPITFSSGQSVKLTGMMTSFNHQNVLLVRTIQMGSNTITVRSDHGFLVYPGAKAHLAAQSSMGGSR